MAAFSPSSSFPFLCAMAFACSSEGGLADNNGGENGTPTSEAESLSAGGSRDPVSPAPGTNGSGGNQGETGTDSGGGNGVGGSMTGSGGATDGSGGQTGESCEGIRDLLGEEQFNALFPNRNPAYTYQGMVDAIEGAGDLIGFPGFVTEGDCDTRKRELAAFLANVARETGQLVYIEQIDKSFAYCQQSEPYGCPAGTQAYFGRGPIQLSWNYNYRAASLALFGDERLLDNPSLVGSDPAIAWATGFWFWMIGGAGGDGSYSPHSVMVDGMGLGATISIINGAEECDGGRVSYAEEAVSQRVCYYRKYTEAFGVSVGGGDLDCGTDTNDSHCRGI